MRAKEILALAGVAFGEILLDRDTTREEFHGRFGENATFPQVVIDGSHIGGLWTLKEYLRMAA